MTLYQVEQLKEDVTGKEAKILRQEKMLSKCEKDKQQLRVDLQVSMWFQMFINQCINQK